MHTDIPSCWGYLFAGNTVPRDDSRLCRNNRLIERLKQRQSARTPVPRKKKAPENRRS
jgi:hypothetical protein